jgi:hypothetical protein
MKLGPLDFKQPSTWRGLLGFAGLIGWTLSPELRDQIALALAAALSAIELFRDEYRAHPASTGPASPGPNPTGNPEPIGPARDPAGVPAALPVRRVRVPAVADTADLDPTDASGGFNDR